MSFQQSFDNLFAVQNWESFALLCWHQVQKLIWIFHIKKKRSFEKILASLLSVSSVNGFENFCFRRIMKLVVLVIVFLFTCCSTINENSKKMTLRFLSVEMTLNFSWRRNWSGQEQRHERFDLQFAECLSEKSDLCEQPLSESLQTIQVN